MLSSSVRKLLLSCLLCVFLVVLCVVPAFASETLLHPQYIGCGWIKGHDSTLGDVEIYVPITSKGSWGSTSTGFLVNISGSSVSGVLITSNGTQYTLSASSFSLPRYRLSTSSGYYDYKDLYLTVSDSNLQVASSYPPAQTAVEVYPLILIGLVGVCILCLKRSKL